MAFGYIYALTNPSIPNLVKVGKTTRTPANRIAELSSATGVPAPFVLAFQQEVLDCDYAEQWVHTQLQLLGFRLSESREFFNAPLHEIVKLMVQASQITTSGGEISAERSADDADNDFEGQLLRLADDYLNGSDTTLINEVKAFQAFNQAASLGSLRASHELGEMYRHGIGTDKNLEKALQSYNRALAGGWWHALASVAQVFCDAKQFGAASRAWDRFFSEAATCYDDSRDIYVKSSGMWCIYAIVVKKHPIKIDEGHVNYFNPQLIEGLNAFSDYAERNPASREGFFESYSRCRTHIEEILATSLSLELIPT